jgi:hypothetical protein
VELGEGRRSWARATNVAAVTDITVCRVTTERGIAVVLAVELID